MSELPYDFSHSQMRELPGAREAFAAAQLELGSLRISLALRRFNPAQPHVPAGHPDGGQRTDGGGSAPVEPVSPRPGGGGARVIRGRTYETTPAQEVRLDVSAAHARALVREVQRHDPNWRPRPSIYEGVEGEILANESAALQAALQAAARLRELGRPEPVRGPMEEILMPNGQHVGMRYRGMDETTRTVTPLKFNELLEALTPGSQMVRSPVGYSGL
ncbi:hypothetical protein [Microvirga thermotolerans]|uniref:hypothetical protein n=1 Tax=Microvirga thermotolerans TaxID=2651334 RepID=UPI001FE3284F|nr:hypothetical protein [Microvirga thermotolerans]